MIKNWLGALAGYQYSSLFILCVCLASPLVTQGNLVPGIIILLAYTAWLAVPLLFYLGTEKWILVLIFLFALLDIPGSRPYYDHLALTEILGSLLFDPLKKVTGVPLPFTFFEFISYFLVFWIFFKSELRNSRLFQVALFVGCGVPVIAWLSAIIGTLRGNSLMVAYTQIRFVSLMAAWSIIGFYLAKRPRDMWRSLQVILVAILMKSLYAIGFFVLILNGSLGKREYLIDHLSSLLMATALFFIFGNIFFRKVRALPLLAWLAAAFVIIIPYILNDRRTSFFGVLMALALMPVVISRKKLKAIFWPMMAAVPCLLLLVAFKVSKGESSEASLSGLLSHVFTAKAQQLDYREIENFNLYFSVINNPLLGLGFGRSFPIIMPMPDISFVFKIFDLIPHNTVLYIWVFAGPLGMAAFGIAVMLPLIACIRMMKYSQSYEAVILAFVTYTLVIGWFCFAYFDMGILDSRAQALFGLLVGAVFSFYQKSPETQSF